MPKTLYGCLDKDRVEHYSFNRDSLQEYEPSAVFEHDAAEFFHEQAERLASGHDSEVISMREVVELFCELYKV